MLGGLRLVSVQQGFDPRDCVIGPGSARPCEIAEKPVRRMDGRIGRGRSRRPSDTPARSRVVVTVAGGAASAMCSVWCAGRRIARARVRVAQRSQHAAVSCCRSPGRESATATTARDRAGVSTERCDRPPADPTVQSRRRLPGDLARPGGAGAKDTAKHFGAEHDRLFSFLLNVDHELVNARATVTGPRPSVAAVTLAEGTGDPVAALVDTHPIHVSGKQLDAKVYDRARLLAGDVVAGPAIVTEMDSTTLVLPEHAATVHASGSLLITPLEG
ncbi:hypothetical protein [Amycolatopsis carbonis]